jgi:hypothetical protein
MVGGNHTVYADSVFDGNYANALSSVVATDLFLRF